MKEQKQFSLARGAMSTSENIKAIPYMKTILTFLLLNLSLGANADQERYVTITTPTPSIYSTNGPYYYFGATNSVIVAEGEAAEVISVEGYNATSIISKDQVSLTARPASGSSTLHGTTVAGPAVLTLSQFYSTQYGVPISQYQGALMTIKLTPMTASAQQSVVVAPGMGNVQITLESSTNLVNWAEATNGVYSDSLRYFRVKLTKSNP